MNCHYNLVGAQSTYGNLHNLNIYKLLLKNNLLKITQNGTSNQN